MKLFQNRCVGLGLCLFMSVTMLSCVNHLSEENNIMANDGNIPLRIVAGIQKIPQTRVIDNEFEEKDAVGLFALVGNTTMKEERYVDNMHFVYTKDEEFVPDDWVYYPDDGVALNLISYFPYQKEGIAMGKSIMPVSIYSEQNVSVNYSYSDFLVASKQDVTASNEAIPLTYKHQFFKLKISLKADENVEDLLESDPQISVCGFYTKAMYDFQTKLISNYSEVKSITPAGNWKVENKRLMGKELILIPQEINSSYQYISIKVGEDIYESLLPSTLQMMSGKQRELEISFKLNQNILLSKVEGDIADWEGTEIDHSESEVINKYMIDVTKLTFGQSNVYKVLHNGQQVAEICKEYLLTPDFASQAIVAYPMKVNTHTVDLSKGLVVKLLGNEENVHGGSVSWKLEENSLEYITGNMAAPNSIYVKTDGQIALSRISPDMLQSISAVSDVACDTRGGVIHNYPIVKIGTQYWMRDNLETSFYNDGQKIPKISEVVEDTVGYLTSSTGGYFYTSKVVQTNKLQFGSWDIPNWKDWNKLKSYLHEDAALLKAGDWRPMKDEAGVKEVNNLSGFNAIPLGFYLGTFVTSYAGRYQIYWTLNNLGTSIDKGFVLQSNNNNMTEGNPGVDKAFSIRCIRK